MTTFTSEDRKSAENFMNAEQKYWYNKGHEDGRNLCLIKERMLTNEDIKNRYFKFCESSGTLQDFKRAILGEESDK